jgi:hypothetical protein
MSIASVASLLGLLHQLPLLESEQMAEVDRLSDLARLIRRRSAGAGAVAGPTFQGRIGGASGQR